MRNPYSRKWSRVSLRPADIGAIVFWSKDYAPLLKRIEAIERASKNLFFHFTITGNRDLEPAAPDYRDAVRDHRFLAERYSPDKVVWRFDPICVTDAISFEATSERFIRCAELLQGHSRTCIISFAHPYRKVIANFQKHSAHMLQILSIETQRVYAQHLAKQAERYGMTLSACCNDHLLSVGIGKAACINGPLLSGLFQTPLDTRPSGMRKECACTRSMDIGAYDTCGHGCVYCYANSDPGRAMAALRRHDPTWNALCEDAAGVEIGAADPLQTAPA